MMFGSRVLVLVVTCTLIAASACSDEARKKAEAVPADASSDGAVADATQSDTSRDDATGANNGTGTAGAHPRWVLYDNAGEPVEAMVGPAFAYDPARPGDLVDPQTLKYDCVSVTTLGNNVWPSAPKYELETGTMLRCYSDSSGHVYYLDENCQGTPHAGAGYGIRRLDSTLYWPKGTVKNVPKFYQYDDSGQCIMREWERDVVALQQVPSEIVNAMTNAPYELRVEY